MEIFVRDNLIKYALATFLVITTLSMTGMISFGMRRDVIYYDVTEYNKVLSEIEEDKSEKYKIGIESIESDDNYLILPTPSDAEITVLAIENDYFNQQIVIKLEGDNKEFYKSNKIKEFGGNIVAAMGVKQDDVTYIIFQLSSIKEITIDYEGSSCRVDFFEPRELYEKIVVIDTACNSSKYCTNIIEKIRKATVDSTIKHYFVDGSDNEDVDARRMLEFYDKIMPDMIIGIDVVDEDNVGHGINAIYNGEYFLPKLDSIRLSDVVLGEVARSLNIDSKNIKMKEATEKDELVIESKYPITVIELVCSNNEMDFSFEGESYERIVRGIIEGTKKAFKIKEENEVM